MNEGFAGRGAPFEDRRMWRLLLARLHPDAGGDRELFLFACALRDEALGSGHTRKEIEENDEERKNGRTAEPLLRAWHDAMSYWASRNREALKRYVPGESPFVPTDDLAIPERVVRRADHAVAYSVEHQST